MAEHNSKDKLELAEKIASQTRKVTKKYEDVESMILHIIRWFSTAIDKFLFNPKLGGAISLVLAMMIFAMVNYSDENSLFGTAYLQSTTLTNQAIVVDYNSDKWEITVSDELCDVVDNIKLYKAQYDKANEIVEKYVIYEQIEKERK